MGIKSTFIVHKSSMSTTLNEIYPSQSFHSDETVVVGKVISSSLISGGPYRKRALFSFGTYAETTGYGKAYLKVYEASSKDLQKGTILEVGFQSASSATGNTFNVGRGRRDSLPAVQEGSTYAFSKVQNGVAWSEQTASVKETVIITGSADIDLDASSLLTAVNTTNQFRFVHVNMTSVQEDDSSIRGEIEYYSSKTHTIYEPTLFISSQSTSEYLSGKEDGDFSLDNDYVLYHTNLRKEYEPGSDITFKFGARELYPAATFGTASSATGKNYIGSGSTYNFKDVKANELILPTSMQSTLGIESDASGHFIANVPANLFYPYRKYQLVINVKSGSVVDRYVLPETFQVGM